MESLEKDNNRVNLGIFSGIVPLNFVICFITYILYWQYIPFFFARINFQTYDYAEKYNGQERTTYRIFHNGTACRLCASAYG